MTPRTSWTVSVAPGWVHAVNAPRGIDFAEEAPTTQRASKPFDSAAAIASWATLLLPTPASPDTITPALSGAAIADMMVLICSVRPISGHDKRIREG